MHFEGIISVPYQAHVAMENCTSCKLLIVEKPYHEMERCEIIIPHSFFFLLLVLCLNFKANPDK